MHSPLRRFIIVIAICSFRPFGVESVAQVKYAQKGEGMTLLGLGYSSLNDIAVWSVQANYTQEARTAIGIHASISESPITRTLGVSVEHAIRKPDTSYPLGFVILLSAARAWIRPKLSYAAVTIEGSAFTGGAAIYLAYPNSPLLPFVQLTRTFSSIGSGNLVARTQDTGFAVGLDVVVGRQGKPRIILTPGVLFTQEQSAFAFSLAIVLNHSTK